MWYIIVLSLLAHFGIVIILLIVCLLLIVLLTLSPTIELLLLTFKHNKSNLPYSTSAETLREFELHAVNEFLNNHRAIQYEFIDSQTYNERSKSILGIHMIKFSKKTENLSSSFSSNKNVLFVHGANSGPVYFFDTVPQLIDQGLDVYCISLPGFGIASMNPHVFDYNSQTISEVMDEYLFNIIEIYFKENVPSLIGHSFGGFIISHFASNYPDRFDKLILINSAGFLPTFDSLGMYWAVLFKLGIPNRIARQVGRCLNPILYSLVDMETSRAWQSIWSIAQMTCRENYGDCLVSKFITYNFSYSYWNVANLDGLLRIKEKIHIIWGHDDNITPIHTAIMFAALHKEKYKAELVSIYVVKNGWHNPIYVNSGQNVSYILKSLFNKDNDEDDKKFTDSENGNDNAAACIDFNPSVNEFYKSTFSVDNTISNINNLYQQLKYRHKQSNYKLRLKIVHEDRCDELTIDSIYNYHDFKSIL